MPNTNPMDNPSNELYGQVVNGYQEPGAAAPPSTGAARAARYFSTDASTSASLGILGGTVNTTIRLNNPAGSGTNIHVASIGGTIDVSLSLLSGFSGQVTMLSGGTLASPSSITASNLYITSPVAGIAAATSSTSAPSGGNTFMIYPAFPSPFRFTYTGGIIIPPGQWLVVNVRGSLTLLGVLGTRANLTWWEG
ncbi:hypothetical protein FHS16_002704 [Paenibacillus endophyticus]|uniref:Uncharacterized protein n=1 Tax=Paenibacillus endophyticus TaxID=1294268 RepID=A0A7W5C7Y0_9BACL|nr:hypothetical protein [Paenibacillus endophyticus]MBB3152647.1 hypothetical protein [Paenibacillus endophyticus]